jgi:hypothetical protein
VSSTWSSQFISSVALDDKEHNSKCCETDPLAFESAVVGLDPGPSILQSNLLLDHSCIQNNEDLF